MCSTIILYFSLIIISFISSLNSSLISPDRQFIPIHTVYGLILSYGSFLWQCCMLIHIIFFYLTLHTVPIMGSHTDSCQFVPFYSIIYLSQVWFINNGHYQQFMPNSYHITLLFVHYRSGLSTMVTISDSCPIHTILPYYLFIIGLVHQQWSLSVIHAQFIPCLIDMMGK